MHIQSLPNPLAQYHLIVFLGDCYVKGAGRRILFKELKHPRASLSNSHTSPHCLDSSKCSRNCPTAMVPLAVEGGRGANAGSAEVDEKVQITSVRSRKAPDRSSTCLSPLDGLPLDSLPLDGLSSDCLIRF